MTATAQKPGFSSDPKTITTGNAGQASAALQVQTYCNSVLNQQSVNLKEFTNLAKYADEINSGLDGAKGHAHSYLNTIQPQIIANNANINAYYTLHNAVSTTLPSGSTEAQWIHGLSLLKQQSDGFLTDSKSMVAQLTSLHDGISNDAGNFGKVVTDLNTAVNGDNGVLSTINGELDSIQSKIDGAIAGMALSGLAIVGGVFVTAVGAIADFVTAGASTPVVVGGVALIAAGVGGEVGSAIALKNLNDEKSNLLRSKAQLTSEVKTASAMKLGYSSLATQAQTAVTAASNMSNAWNSLSADLGLLVGNLQKGITNAQQARSIWLTVANSEIQNVLTDTNIIKQQMAGVNSIVATPGQTVGDAIVAAVEKKAA
ncbi:MAG: HBL/NHE enterotoxin family protein [Planctomycetota bacterium]